MAISFTEAYASSLEQVRATIDQLEPIPGYSGIHRVEIPFSGLSPANWLHQLSCSQKVFWSSRDNTLTIAGVGDAIVVSDADTNLRKLLVTLRSPLNARFPRMRFYGGIRFLPTALPHDHWQRFGAFRFHIPLIECGSDESGSYIAINMPYEDGHPEPESVREIISISNTSSDSPAYHGIDADNQSQRTDSPNHRGWLRAVNQAVDSIHAGAIKKTVLARETEFSMRSIPHPLWLLDRLLEQTKHCYHYCFQLDDNLAFIGASPERLYSRKGDQVFSEALASTRPRGDTPEEDEQLGKDLLNSPKDRHEHKLVIDHILELLSEHCLHVDASETPEILKLTHLQHLLCSFSGTLTSVDSESDLLQALHPTPAVGGTPKEAAIQAIQSVESFDRGWYAGPVGWVGSDATEFAVAIRSGLIDSDCVRVYTGAGIVGDSNPQEEWMEIENKLKDFLSIFKQSDKA
jgi:menaquinone-specific isochorismate synthase